MSMLLQAKNVGALLNVVLHIAGATVHALVGQTSQPFLYDRKMSAFACKTQRKRLESYL